MLLEISFLWCTLMSTAQLLTILSALAGKPIFQIGSRLPEDIENNPSIQFHYLRELPRVPESMPRILYCLYAPIKAMVLAFQLFNLAMFYVAAPEVYMVQVMKSINHTIVFD